MVVVVVIWFGCGVCAFVHLRTVLVHAPLQIMGPVAQQQ